MQSLITSYPFCIGLLYLYLDEYDAQTESDATLPPIPMIEDVVNNNKIVMENGKYIIHRGDSIMSTNEIVSFYNSLMMINSTKQQLEAIIEGCNSEENKVNCFSYVHQTSFLSLLVHFIVKEVQEINGSLTEEQIHYLKTIGRLFMKILFM